MSLLAEYALSPDVFDITSYSSDEVGDIRLQSLKEVVLHEALVRNLRDGRWLHVFMDNGRPWHKRGKELLKKLVTQNRLNLFSPVLTEEPIKDEDWCHEAVASHRVTALSGVITTSGVAEAFSSEKLVSSIDKLSNTIWWQKRSSSVRLGRTISDYQENMHLVLRSANSLMFIDPHLDPSLPRYSDFVTLLTAMADRLPKPLIEIHRVCYFGSGRSRKIISETEWKSRFKQGLSKPLETAGLEAKVFVWDDFHDRYLISNLVGINVPNGFDTTNQPGSMTTWTRLGRDDRDDIQREFDHPASNRHKLKCKFKVP